jgi:predicted  nucleic acid-binding Zn-ribbon protein
MNEEPTKDLATRAFYKRVLDEFAALRHEIAELRSEVAEVRAEQSAMRAEVAEIRAEQSAMRAEVAEIRAEQSAMRNDITEMRTEIVEIRTQQAAMARNIGSLDHRLTSLEERVDARLKETRPIWEAVQEQLQRLGEKFDGVILEFYELRNEVKIHGRRIGHLEDRVPG